MDFLIPVLYVITILDFFAFTLVITSLNRYVFFLGGTQFYLGVLSSVASLINLIWNPIVGSLGDTFGRKIIILQCMLICTVGNLLTAFTSSLVVFFIARVLTSFGTQIIPLLKSLMDDNVDNKEVKTAFLSKIQALQGLCFIFGPLASGYLSELEDGYRKIFYIVSAIFITNLGLIKFLPISVTKKTSKESKQIKISEEIKTAITNIKKINWSKFWDIFIIKTIVDFTFTVFHFNFISTLMGSFGITGKSFGYVFASVSTMTIVISLLMNKLKKRFYNDDTSGLKRLFHGCIIFGYSFIGMGLSSQFWIYYLHLTLIPVARVIFDTTFSEVILARSGADEKGKVMGVFEMTVSFGGLTAPLLSGIVSDIWGSSVCNFLCAGLLVSAGLIARQKKEKAQ